MISRVCRTPTAKTRTTHSAVRVSVSGPSGESTWAAAAATSRVKVSSVPCTSKWSAERASRSSLAVGVAAAGCHADAASRRYPVIQARSCTDPGL